MHFLYICLYFDYKKRLLFFNLQCFDIFFFLVRSCLETLDEFRSLKYASVYVTVPFQSASELSFPSAVFSGVKYKSGISSSFGNTQTSVNSQGHSRHLYSHAVCKGVGMCEGVSVDTHSVYLYIRRYTPH